MCDMLFTHNVKRHLHATAVLWTSWVFVRGWMSGRCAAIVSDHLDILSLLRSCLKEFRKGRLSPCRGWSSKSTICMPVWSEPREAAQSMTGGVRAREREASRLCHIKSKVLGCLWLAPRQVMSPVPVISTKVCPAARCLRSAAFGERSKPSGDQDCEWMLKSPTRIVGIVGSRSRAISEWNEEGSSVLW